MYNIFKKKYNVCFLSYFTKYVLIILLFSISFIPLYAISYNSIKSNVIEGSIHNLEKGILSLDADIDGLVKIVKITSNDKKIKEALLLKSPLKPRDYCTLIEAKTYLSTAVLYNDLVVNSYIISQKNKIFLSSSYIDIDRFNTYNNAYFCGDSTYDEWVKCLLGLKDRFTFLPAAQSTSIFEPILEERLQNIIHFVVPTPIDSIYKKDAVMAFMLDEKVLLQSLISSDLQDTGFFYMFDKNGTIIVNKNYNNTVPLNLTDKITNQVIDGVPMTMLQMKSERSGLTFVRAVPNSVFSNQIKPFTTTVFIYIAIGILGALLLSIIFAYKISKPIINIVKLIKQIIPESSAVTKNNFELISGTLFNLHIEKTHYQQQLIVNEASIENYLIGNVLHDELHSNSDIARAEQLFGSSTNYYCVCMMNILLNDDNISAVELSTSINLIVEKLINKQITNHYYIHVTEKLKSTIIINLQDENMTSTSDITAVFTDISNTINNTDKFHVCFGIGSLVFGVDNIYISRQNALSAMKFCDVMYSVNSYYSSNLPKKRTIYNNSLSKNLKEILNTGDLTEIKKFFDQKIKKVFKNDCDSEDDICQNFYNIRGIIQNVMNDYPLPSDVTDNLLPPYLDSNSIDDLTISLEKSCICLCEHIERAKSQNKKQIRLSIIEYIQNNYSDSLLSALSIAEAFSISEKYIFNIVKEETGKSLGEYIETIRFNKAEELLRSDVLINQIPELIGYNSINTFYKAFKRIYGVSPGKWRETLCKKV